MSIETRIRELLSNHEIVLFMKGTRAAPSCGFSATVVEILDEYVDDYRDVDVLSSAELREAIKAFTSWPTIPQLFVRGEFVGGADIVKEMAASGELEALLGKSPKPAEVPDVRLTEKAVAALRSFMDAPGKPVVRLKVSASFQYSLDFDEPRKGDLTIDAGEYAILVDRPSSKRLDGTVVDFLERPDGGGFKIDNPNAVSSCGCGHSFQVAEGEDAPAAGGGCGSGCH